MHMDQGQANRPSKYISIQFRASCVGLQAMLKALPELLSSGADSKTLLQLLDIMGLTCAGCVLDQREVMATDLSGLLSAAADSTDDIIKLFSSVHRLAFHEDVDDLLEELMPQVG